jgi:LacI family transcriptional regulator
VSKNMTITIKDISQVAGVSYSTVSKALNDSPLVKPETKAKIMKIAKDMGYQPNLAAKQLVSKQSKVIGVIWPTLERVVPSVLVTKLNEELSRHSYSMILSISPVNTSMDLFKRFQVDGVIAFDEQGHEILEATPLPIITFGVGKNKGFPVIDVNYQEAMQTAVAYLHHLGHRKITYIGDFSPIDDRQKEKYYGFQHAMQQLGLPLNSSNLINTAGLDWYDGFMATKRLLQSTTDIPTAIIGSSYDISAGIIRALREANKIIPNDISVISYDNISQMTNMEIPITCVGVPIEEIAHQIVVTLLQMIKDRNSVPQVKTLTPTITERTSCAKI